MLLLAVDTSGRQGSIALARCEQGDACEVIEVAPLPGGTFSAELVPQIAALLEKHGVNKADIGAFAVVSGPGSFTGLRIGLAVIKALAEALAKPIAAVSLLEAVASASHSRGRVTAALEAGRNEVFLGEYHVGTMGMQVIPERLRARDEWLESASEEMIFTPDHGIAEAARAKGLHVVAVEQPRSDAIAELGWRKIVSGQTVSPDALEASYIGRSDAELFVKADNSVTRCGEGGDALETVGRMPALQMRIRHATRKDIPAMMALEKHAPTAARWSTKQYETAFSGEAPLRVVMLIEEEACVQGFIAGRTIGDEWEIENIAVAGATRRRGLGTRLLGEFLDLARGRGAEAVFLEVRESNLAARQLYEKWAFVESGRRKVYYREPEEDAVVYRLGFA
jgi:tRNA threonylcarbamoyladenosine biosynthesis protein TsaB